MAEEKTFCVYVDNELEESDLTKEEALELEAEIMDEDPEAIITVEPSTEDEAYMEDDEPDDWDDDDEDEDEDEQEE